MTTLLDIPARPALVGPAPLEADDDRFVELAAAVGRAALATAASHDADGTFVVEAYQAMGRDGYLRLAVPAELGGLGATLRQVCYAQAELARADGAAALAVAMHHYNVLLQVHRWRHGAEGAAGVLGRVADEGLILATSGGSDWLWPTTVAEPEPGGYRVSGRKVFCSQAPVAGVLTTSAVVGSPGPDAEVIHFALPLSAPGVTVVETWDTLGMRGTASHDLQLEGVQVAEAAVVARRPWGRFNAALLGAGVHFAPVVGATYWGIGAGALEAAVHRLAGPGGARPGRGDDLVDRQVGLAATRLRVAWWSLLGAVTEAGSDPALDEPTMAMLMAAKREAVLAAGEVVDVAMGLAGGSSFFRGSPLERAWRDVRAGTFHPLDPELTLRAVGRVALGRPLDEP